MTDVKISIGKNELGVEEWVYFEGINSMRNTLKSANIVWLVRQVDEDGKPIESLRINQDRIVITPISNENKVTQDGILIIRQNFESEEAYEATLERGIPEYDFWMYMITTQPLPEIMMQAAALLNQFRRFDRA